jgi:putative membrane-bound dehydrogenase-like protein
MRIFVVAIAAGILAACGSPGPPYRPAQALKKFQIEDGYRIELFASEPDIVSPVAMDFDENGDLYVVEHRGYPLNVAGKVGRVKLRRGGRWTVFVSGLVMPTGIMRWKKGVLVTDAPDIWYFEDTNGDGVADVRRRMITGFPFTNPQHTVNGPVYGLDNWIYVATENPATAIIFREQFGDRGSDIRWVDRDGVAPLVERGRNVRFRPDTGEIESLSSSSQFGQSFDNWGRHFTVGNSNHVRMETIAARYLKRNPDLPAGAAVEDISDHGASAKVFPITVGPRFELLSGVGEFTSACGILYFGGSTFVAEPVHGIVHRDVLSDAGSIYLARRKQEGREFLASTDPWFRPVNLYAGPDGAIYVIDYYRLVIEHPEWMSGKYQSGSTELYEGADRGRIYRIVPEGVGAAKDVRLGSEANAELVRELASPIAWRRRTAQRLLLDRAANVAAELEQLFRETASPEGRVHALWTLEGLGRLDDGLIRAGLKDAAPGVRENAIRLAEKRLSRLEPDLLAMSNEPDSRARFQLALTLGSLTSEAARSLRERMLFANLEDKWFQMAVLSAGSSDAPRMFLRAAAEAETPGRSMLVRNLAAEIGARQQAPEVEAVLQRVASGGADWWRVAALEGLNSARRGRQAMTSPRAQGLLLAIYEKASPAVRRPALRGLEIAGLPKGADRAVAHARAVAGDASVDAALRADSIGLLALAGPEHDAELFRSLIDPRQPDAVQSAAVRAYGRVKGDEPGAFLLKNWRALSPAVRGDAADALFLDSSRQWLLVAAMQHDEVQPWTLAFRHKRRLIMSNDGPLRTASRLLLEPNPKDREEVVKRYGWALHRVGYAARGREVFRSVCTKCHRLEGQGAEVGPNLLTVQNQSKDWLMANILMPSQAIAQGYEAYVVETAGGTFDGVIARQSPASVTLRHEDGKEDVIQRADIRNMYVTNLSAMPGDLEKQVSGEQMADLLEYLKTVR